MSQSLTSKTSIPSPGLTRIKRNSANLSLPLASGERIHIIRSIDPDAISLNETPDYQMRWQ